jgi:hypothetical protein
MLVLVNTVTGQPILLSVPTKDRDLALQAAYKTIWWIEGMEEPSPEIIRHFARIPAFRELSSKEFKFLTS